MIFKQKRMKKISTLLIAAGLAFTSVSKAQQDAQYTQFMYMKQAYNPAYVGTSGTICFDGLYRQQWVNFPGAPKTGVFAFNMPFGNFGAGLMINSDQIGFQKTFMARLAGAYHFIIGTGKLSVGIDAGVYQTSINGTWVAPQTLAGDAAIPTNTVTGSPALNKLTPDFGAGLYYTIPNKMYIGISTTHLAGQELQGAQKQSFYNLTFDVARHYYLIAGYTFNVSADFDLMPNIKVKTDAASTQLDVNLIGMIKKTVGIGVSYRLQDAIAPMLVFTPQTFAKGLRLGYSYDVTTSKIKGYSAGTHEITLGYCLKPKNLEKKESHWNTRYFED